MKSLIAILDQALEKTLIFLMGVLVLDVLWQVISRFILQDPSAFTDELARFLLIWLSLLGGSYMMGKKQHLAIDLITPRLSPKQLIVLDILINAIIIIFSTSVLIIGGSRLVFVTLYLSQTSAALGVPLGYIYMVLPLSGIIMSLYGLFFILEDSAKLKSQRNLNPE